MDMRSVLVGALAVISVIFAYMYYQNSHPLLIEAPGVKIEGK